VPSIAEAIRGAKTVVHLATSTTPAIADADPNLELENIRLTVALIDACVSERVSHLIFASSGGTIYGDTGSSPATETLTPNPSCVYAVGKLAIENLLRLATERTSLKTTVLRISNPYGGSQTLKFAQGVVSYLANQAVARKPIHLLGNTVRDYVHVDDVSVAFVASILNAPKGHEIYNISSGIGSTLTDLCSKISEILGVSLEVCVGERRPFDLEYNVLESYKAQALLGWKPRIALAEGLRRYLSTFSGVSFP